MDQTQAWQMHISTTKMNSPAGRRRRRLSPCFIGLSMLFEICASKSASAGCSTNQNDGCCPEELTRTEKRRMLMRMWQGAVPRPPAVTAAMLQVPVPRVPEAVLPEDLKMAMETMKAQQQAQKMPAGVVQAAEDPKATLKPFLGGKRSALDHERHAGMSPRHHSAAKHRHLVMAPACA
jgi:hypothetical protein